MAYLMQAHYSRVKGLFVTGTDTGVGKTWVGSRLARLLTRDGVTVAPRKPAESGCESVDGELVPADAIQYYQAIKKREPLDIICPNRFTRAIAPDQAARRAGQRLSLETLTKACQCNDNHFLMVEGAGGFYSPIAEDGLNADLAQALNLPLLLVAADRLGCQNHVLLTLEAIARRGLQTVAVVLNRISSEPGDSLHNDVALRQRTAIPVFSIPHGPASGEELKSLSAFLRTTAWPSLVMRG